MNLDEIWYWFYTKPICLDLYKPSVIPTSHESQTERYIFSV